MGRCKGCSSARLSCRSHSKEIQYFKSFHFDLSPLCTILQGDSQLLHGEPHRVTACLVETHFKELPAYLLLVITFSGCLPSLQIAAVRYTGHLKHYFLNAFIVWGNNNSTVPTLWHVALPELVLLSHSLFLNNHFSSLAALKNRSEVILGLWELFLTYSEAILDLQLVFCLLFIFHPCCTSSTCPPAPSEIMMWAPARSGTSLLLATWHRKFGYLLKIKSFSFIPTSVLTNS